MMPHIAHAVLFFVILTLLVTVRTTIWFIIKALLPYQTGLLLCAMTCLQLKF